MGEQLKRAQRQPWFYTREEQERLEALAAPWPLRPFTYLHWLCCAMPPRTGAPLMLALWGTVICIVVLVVYGLMMALTWIGTHAAWVYWGVLGMVGGLGVRAILHDALAAERRVRHSITAKEHDEIEA